MYSPTQEGDEESHNTNIFDIAEDWRQWCRLCAKEDTQNINIYNEHMGDATESVGSEEWELQVAIGKYFNVDIKPDNELPIQLCTDCFYLVTSLINFNERVIKVQQMYCALQRGGSNTLEELDVLRQKYEVLKDDGAHDFMYRSHSQTNLFQRSFQLHDPEEVYIEVLQGSTYEDGITNENSNDGVLIAEDVSDIALNDDDDDDINFYDEIKSESRSANYNRKKNTENKNTISKSRLYNHSIVDRNSHKIRVAANLDVTNHENTKQYNCPECSKSFKLFTYYRLHMEREHERMDIVPEYVCSECDVSFNTSTKLKNHNIKKHTPLTERRVIPCPFCDNKFATKKGKLEHIKFVHFNERPVICEQCGECTRNNGELKKHMLTHTDYAPFECEICKKCFKNRERLKKHLEIHSPSKHTCPECGLQLNSRSTMNNHLLVHSDVKSHKCDFCGKAFKRAKELKNHLILHTGLKPYACEFCEKTYANASNFRGHKKKAHPAELAAKEAAGEKPYTKNIPKLAVLKSVIQASKALTPVISKKAGGKRKLSPDDSIKISTKKQLQLHDDPPGSTSTINIELIHPTNCI